MCSAFDFIEGSIKGAKKRFANRLGKSLKSLTKVGREKLAKCLDISPDELINIPISIDKYFLPKYIEPCAIAFNLNLQACFKKSKKLSLKKERELNRRVKKWGGYCVAGASNQVPSRQDMTELFLMTQAIKELESK